MNTVGFTGRYESFEDKQTRNNFKYRIVYITNKVSDDKQQTIPVKFWGDKIEMVGQMAQPGDMVIVTGMIRVNTSEKNGQTWHNPSINGQSIFALDTQKKQQPPPPSANDDIPF